ncbi:MAG: AraC family transcriptional regulator [Burkholderiales bacterium]
MTIKNPRTHSAAPDIHAPAVRELGSFHVSNLKLFPDIVRELGGNPRKLLNDCGIDPMIFAVESDDESAGDIPLSTFLHLLDQTARQVGCPHFGLILGQRLENTLIDPIGFLMQNSPTVEAALEQLIRFLHVRTVGAAVDISSSDGIARIAFTLLIPDAIGSDQFCDLAIANFVTFMWLACGKDWRPSSVLLSRKAPADKAPYRDLFGMSVRFAQSTNVLLFPAETLKYPIAHANPRMGEVIKTYVSQLEEQHKGDLAGQIRRVLLKQLPTGKCTIDRVADLFKIHRRTLHRRLAEQDLTFEMLVEEARQEIAIRALTVSEMSIKQVAAMLGYRDTSAFSRAFRRWVGTSPSLWRSQFF